MLAGTLPPIAAIRAHFPALTRTHAGALVAYFDGPGGTQVPRAVADAMVDYLYHHNANTHWAYPTSAETDNALASARETFAAFFNGRPDEIVFGANMTTLTMHLARALVRDWDPGDEIVVTELDHHANIDPWVEAARDRDLVVHIVRLIPETGQLDWEDLKTRLSRRTRLLAIGAASNAIGTVSDVACAADLARAHGALTFVDGVHFAPHHLPDVRALGCDGFACSPYKFYGPHVGALWLRRDLLAEVDFPRLVPASHDPPERGETGTLNHEGIVGAAAAVAWLASLAGTDGDLRARLGRTYADLHLRGAELLDQLWTGLADTDGVTLFGPALDQPRTPTVAFTVDGLPSEAVARQLADAGVFVSHGDFYAYTAVARLGQQPEGLVRAGCACYTSADDVAQLVAAVRSLVRGEPLHAH
ncbi:MAG: cysteine desulfurase-like protein [Gemmatimonadota bacterium]|nr:cysteine desulfurase-like protein [Gemmatimonadota bacterium]MDH4349987.1 cysteine desulfurase-like protein [Gemmatimonadota bacterium]MDH5198076.1 cysteine desulfurase-like protein [Gemmatimonadota bacterium]